MVPNARHTRKNYSQVFWSIFRIVLLVYGFGLATAGLLSVMLGGSPVYLISGGLLITSGVMAFWNIQRSAVWCYLALVASVAWAVSDVGLNFWLLVPRVDVALALAAVFAVAAICRSSSLATALRRVANIIASLNIRSDDQGPLLSAAGLIVALGLVAQTHRAATDANARATMATKRAYSDVTRLYNPHDPRDAKASFPCHSLLLETPMIPYRCGLPASR